MHHRQKAENRSGFRKKRKKRAYKTDYVQILKKKF